MSSAASGRERYLLGDLLVDVGQQSVTGPAGEIVLPKLSFDLLLALVRRAPDFVSNDELAALVWAGVVVSPETVTKRVTLLRAALGDNAERPRYVAGLRNRGYRVVVPVNRAVDAAADEVSASRSAASTLPSAPTETGSGASPAPLSPRRVIGRALAIAALSAAAFLAWQAARRERITDERQLPAMPSVADVSVAVMPFESLGLSQDDAYLAVGLPEMVLDQLSAIPNLTVIASSGAQVPPGSLLDARQLGARTGARYVVLGSVQHTGPRLRVSSRLVDTRTGTQVWSTTLDKDLSGLFAIQDTIAAQVAAQLRKRVDGVSAPARTGGYQPPIEAQLAYLQGRVLLNRYTVRGADEAAVKFGSAVDIDPHFAAAAAGLFDARMFAAERRHQNLAAERARNLPLIDRALAIDPNCGAAYIARAIWGGAPAASQETDFRRGLQLDPSNGRGLVAYSEFLDRQGRHDEGVRELERALVVDPLSPRVHFRMAARQFDLTGAQSLESGMKAVLEIDPDYQPALQRYGKYRWQHGHIADAAQIMEHAIEVDPENPWSRYTACAIYLDLGDPQSARDRADGTASSRVTSTILLALYAGDWRRAGLVALSPAGTDYNRAESWGVPEAVRDYALHTGDYARAISFLEKRYGLTGDEPDLSIDNFRAAAYLAQLLRASGQLERATRLLGRLPAAIDGSTPRYGALYALRTKASVEMLSGQRDEALRTLAESFDSGDLSQWWYTLDHDPLWEPLRHDPVFIATAAQVRARIARERAALADARRRDVASKSAQAPPESRR
jgi:TolB-like protein/DNA-binding winged helix-turn-helix (wHTH) protein/Tfp pilus assembly protein PilF